MPDTNTYRIFISYSHQDHELVLKISEILEDNGFKPMWDRDLRFGEGFHEQIKNFIAHAHVFLPVITPISDKRKWVHQEIGYAMALNIPVLPVAAGKVPGEMIQQIHAVRLDDNFEQLQRHLSREAVSNLVEQHSSTDFALFSCANFPENRAAMMAKYCNDVLALGVRDLFRQKGALSSLNIPDKTINHPVWKARYGASTRGQTHCDLQRKERLAIDQHVKSAGCKLIINPNISYGRYGQSARIVRLECLADSLGSLPDSKCQVVINPNMKHSESVTILGDWFSAESVSARIGEGYRQTIFTRHAPSMLKKIEEFDQEFEEHLDALGWNPETSRREAVSRIHDIIADLSSNRE